jgi:hypothetical protein
LNTIYLGKDAPAVFQQSPPGLRERHSASIAFKEHLPELQLKGSHLSAQDRLRDGEEICRPGEAP